jgi:hypothetical protein
MKTSPAGANTLSRSFGPYSRFACLKNRFHIGHLLGICSTTSIGNLAEMRGLLASQDLFKAWFLGGAARLSRLRVRPDAAGRWQGE